MKLRIFYVVACFVFFCSYDLSAVSWKDIKKAFQKGAEETGKGVKGVVQKGVEAVEKEVIKPTEKAVIEPIKEKVIEPTREKVIEPITKKVIEPIRETIIDPIEKLLEKGKWHLVVLNDTPEVFRLSIGHMGAFVPFAISGAIITAGAAAIAGAVLGGAVGAGAAVAGAAFGTAGYQAPYLIAGALAKGGYDLMKKDAIYILPYSKAKFSTKSLGQCWARLRAYHMIKDEYGNMKESNALWLVPDRGPNSMMCENFVAVITYTKEKHDLKGSETGRIIRRKGDPIPDAYGNYRINILRGQGAKDWIKKNSAAVEQRRKELEENIKKELEKREVQATSKAA